MSRATSRQEHQRTRRRGAEGAGGRRGLRSRYARAGRRRAAVRMGAPDAVDAIFVYGTLMSEEVFEAVVGRPPRYVCTDAVLESGAWERRACDGRVYPALVPRPPASPATPAGVRGRVITGLGDEDMFLLDAFEDEYAKEVLDVRLRDGGTRACYVYVYSEIEPWVTERAWNYEAFRRDHLAEYLAGCRRFRAEMLEALAAADS